MRQLTVLFYQLMIQGLLSSGRSLRPVKNRGGGIFTEIYVYDATSSPLHQQLVNYFLFLTRLRLLSCFLHAITICSKCTTFDPLFFRKVIKIDAIRCRDFRSKCTKMRLAAVLRPDPRGELTALPQTPLAGFEGSTSKGEGGEMQPNFVIAPPQGGHY